MSLFLALKLPPREDGTQAAFLSVAGVPVLTRLAISAARAGVARIALVGDDDDVREGARTLRTDSRLAGVEVVEGTGSTAADVTATANVVVGVPAWKALFDADAPAYLPGAEQVRTRGEGAPRSAWSTPPRGAYVASVKSGREVRSAKQTIFRNVTKSTSGPISRHVNSKLSIPISKLLSETPVTPNQITAANTVIGLLGGVFFAVGDPCWLALGGLFVQLTAALDRCDGEIARSKHMESENGAWIDSIGDNITYVGFVVGLAIGYGRFVASAPVPWASYAWVLGAGTIAMTMLLIVGMFSYVRANALGGTMTAIASSFDSAAKDPRSGLVFRVLHKLKVLGKRDQFSVALMIAAMLPALTGDDGWYHFLFFAVAGFVVLASIYFLVGTLRARAAARHAT